jgi:hypothetical protein
LDYFRLADHPGAIPAATIHKELWAMRELSINQDFAAEKDRLPLEPSDVAIGP